MTPSTLNTLADNSLSLAAPRNNLRRLSIIRGLLIISLCFTLFYAHSGLQLQLPYTTLALILSAVTIFSGVSWLASLQSKPVTEEEFFVQLLFDLLYITLLLYFCGGANNPFVSYYLVPLCIAAATLSGRHAALLTGGAVAAYTLLMFYHIPIAELAPQDHSHHLPMNSDSPWNIHTLGMWINFLVSALLISYFVVQMARNVREQNKALNQLREDEMRNQQLMAVATLAAGTAHELGTPLSTMKTLLSEMQDDYREAAIQDDLKLLQTQLQQCQKTLRNLVGRAEQNQTPGDERHNLRQFCDDIIEQWLILRPEADADIQFRQQQRDIEVEFDPTVGQSILNLLNNATDANPKGITVEFDWDLDYFYLTIEDCGPGIPLAIAEKLGRAFVSNKEKGFGLGLFLSHASISRYGGEVKLFNRDPRPGCPRGTRTTLKLPLNREPQ